MTEGTITAVCPDTGEELTLPAGTEAGEIVMSGDGGEYEVVKVEGGTATLELAPEADEDWGE